MTAGTYTDTLIGATGCDSIVVLNLQLNGSIHTSIYDTICGVQHFYSMEPAWTRPEHITIL